MKSIVLLAISVAAVIAWRCAAQAHDSPTNANASVGIPDVVVDFIRSKDRLLTDLAAERYLANSNRNEIWVFTVHEGKFIRKYTDSKYVLLSLPVLEPADRNTMQAYATAYNCGNLRAADLGVKAGKYKEARDMYQLLLRFACWGKDDVWRPQIERRLTYLSKLEQGQDVEGSLRKLLEMSVDYSTYFNVADIQTMSPLVVTNLLEVSNR